MNKKILSILAIVVIVAIVVVAIILLYENQSTGPTGSDVKNEIAKEIYGLTGTIKKIKGKTLTLEALIPPVDAQKSQVGATIKTTVTDQTKIVKIKFPEDVATDSKEPVYPEETVLNFSDLKVGDKIDIGMTENVYEKIINQTEFDINTIYIIE